MYTLYKTLVLLLVFSFLLACKTKTTGWRKQDNDTYGTKHFNSLPKQIKKNLSFDFVLINKGQYVSGNISGSDTFSVLLEERRLIISSLYMAKHEVSVAEFMQFYYETNNIANKPDTLCFLKDFNNSEARLMSSVYFWHPKYSVFNYPICGVSLEQAIRFCEWKTEKINALLKNFKELESRKVTFRLPTAFELEYAMNLVSPQEINQKFPFKNVVKNSNTNGVSDENGIRIIDEKDDGFLFSSPAKYYKFNTKGLYNLYGNVAELTITPIHQLTQYKSFSTLSVYENNESISDRDVNLNTITPQNTQHYNRVLEIAQDSTYYVAKGSSFAHGQYYTQPAAFIPVKKNENHSWLGFRLIMEIN
jgi:formylglycine-generating enzyme required for sulfatase activity